MSLSQIIIELFYTSQYNNKKLKNTILSYLETKETVSTYQQL